MEAPAALKKCGGCHGKDMNGKPDKTPKINGEKKSVLLAAMGHGIAADGIADNLEPAGNIPKKMKGVAKKLTNAEKEAIASWLSAQK